MKEFDKVFFEFPLCLLSFSKHQTTEIILSYCLVQSALEIKVFDKRIYRNKKAEDLPYDFDLDEDIDCLIVFTADELEIPIRSVKVIRGLHSEARQYIREYEFKHGKDAYCRVGKSILLETNENRFNLSMFTVLCAISSILGKKTVYKRITKQRIAHRMLGYKSLQICEVEESIERMLSRRQIERIINTLHEKKFFGKFTYMRRITYYSSKIDDDQLKKTVYKNKVEQIKKPKKSNDDMEYSILIKQQLTKLRNRNNPVTVH